VTTLKRVLLIIGGGIAAYKCLELIRRARENNIAVRAIMTGAAHHFVTALSVGALTGDRVFTKLFDLDEEREIGHIRLSREVDLIVVAPASADLLAKMAGGHADDLATAVLMASNRPILVAPAMNPRMWLNPATRRNIALLQADGIHFVGPNIGEMAEREEAGPGRMAEPEEILAAIETLLESVATSAPGGRQWSARTLSGRHVVVTAGPTHEPIDPVRYIANRSSGKQGYAIARIAAALGARVTLVSGPVAIAEPIGVKIVRVETANEMLAAVRMTLPADIAIFAAAVADWRVANAQVEKIKKDPQANTPKLELTENPDILSIIAHQPAKTRPPLVIGFAAETENVVENAKAKRKSKGCDWIVANDVGPTTEVMGGDRNTVHLITAQNVESWPEMDKDAVAAALIARAADHIVETTGET
jgi:phosphopantothenoylcysteine decarboxylase / phosphopantothenate---cysteine ligase